MEFSVTFDAKAKLRIQTLSGEATVEDLMEAVKAVHRHPEFDPTYDYIWDFSECRLDDVTSNSMAEFASFIHRKWDGIGDPPRGAIVASRDLEFGLTRVLGIYLGDGGDLCEFRDIEEAKAWLSSL